MKSTKKKPSRGGEPVGIVISGPALPPQTTVFSAYIWGPAPTDDKDPHA